MYAAPVLEAEHVANKIVVPAPLVVYFSLVLQCALHEYQSSSTSGPRRAAHACRGVRRPSTYGCCACRDTYASSSNLHKPPSWWNTLLLRWKLLRLLLNELRLHLQIHSASILVFTVHARATLLRSIRIPRRCFAIVVAVALEVSSMRPPRQRPKWLTSEEQPQGRYSERRTLSFGDFAGRCLDPVQDLGGSCLM